MTRFFQIAALLLAPVAVFLALMAFDSMYGLPGRGYDYVVRVTLPPAGGRIGLPRVWGPQDASRPLVVLDPGHGGHDPGAGTGLIKEKQLTLALAQALRTELLKQGGVRVALTRDDDRYLMLTERYAIARQLGADLFLSIHADSVAEGDARGASVYTLSEKGTSQAAARIAERENMADTVNGVQLADTSDAVGAILVELSQRETQARSEDFARILLREARGRMLLHKDEVQSAAFVVLKAPDMPSVLFEAGYISHPRDTALLASLEGQQTFANATAQAIRATLAKAALE